jgi:hypothetical protein
MRTFRLVAFVILYPFLGISASAVDLAQVVEFHIDPQRLSTALLEFSHQANVQILVGPEVGDRNSAGVSGRLSIGRALRTLLRGTPLVFRVVNETSIAVVCGDRCQHKVEQKQHPTLLHSDEIRYLRLSTMSATAPPIAWLLSCTVPVH